MLSVSCSFSVLAPLKKSSFALSWSILIRETIPRFFLFTYDLSCDELAIFQVLESGSQDYSYFQKLLDYALGIVMKLTAPARDCDTRKSFDLLLQELSQFSTDKGEKSLNLFRVALVKGLRFVLEQIQVYSFLLGIVLFAMYLFPCFQI